MTAAEYSRSVKVGLELPWWLTHAMAPVNENFDERVVSLPQSSQWRATQILGIDLRVLEYIPGDNPRLTAQLRLHPEFSPARLGDNPDLEILMQRGELETLTGVYPAGLYLRLPLTGEEQLQSLTLKCTRHFNAFGKCASETEQPALLYLAAGQMLISDSEHRRINTREESHWLPGPTTGTDVLPLHGHGTGNVMLIRWTETDSFKPGLDPMGDEVLVLSGMLHDEDGKYPAGSWIRNPLRAWQSWGANEGTVVYYKNGHFPTTNTDS
ncbi:MAG: hypothetical protein ACJA0Z_003250 [Halioglobus sp.]|jgi:hypothetical protein